MALALADSIACAGRDLNDQVKRYIAWWRQGEYSVIRATKDLAEHGKIPKLTSHLEAEFGKRKAEQTAARPLSDDSLYADLLKTQAPDDQSAIGVLVEPSVTMDAAHFSFGAQLTTAAAALSMHLAGVPLPRSPGANSTSRRWTSTIASLFP